MTDVTRTVVKGGLGLHGPAAPAAAAPAAAAPAAAAPAPATPAAAAPAPFMTPAKTFTTPENFCFGSPGGYPTIDGIYDIPLLSSFQDVGYFFK